MKPNLGSTWKPLLTNKLFLAVGFSSLYCALLLPYFESIAFHKPGVIYVRIGMRLLFWALLSVGVYYLVGLANELRRGSKRHRDWAIGAAVSFLFFGSFLLLTWPGYWSWDEYHILSGIRDGAFPRWQGFLTVILYTFYLYLLPSGAFFVLFQIVVVSCVAGYVFSVARELLPSRKNLAWLVLVPLCLPSSIIMVLYPLRLTIYAMVILALFFRLIRVFKLKTIQVRPTVEIIAIASVLCVLATWRSEGVAFILLLPIIYWRLGFFSKRIRRTEKLIGFSIALAIIFAGFGANLATTSPKYAITAIVSPLSIMLQDKSNWQKDDADFQALSKVVDLELISRNPSASEIPSFWSPEWQSNTSKGTLSFMIPYLSYVSRNPQDFLAARIATLLATSRFDVEYSDKTLLGLVQNPFMSDPSSYSPPHPIYKFEKENLWGTSLSWETRKTVILSLLMIDRNGKPINWDVLFWNVLPGLGLTLLSLGISLIRRQRLYLMYSISLLTFAFMIFLFAPAAYFMYYFPIAVAGSMICIIQLLEVFSGQRNWGIRE